MLLWLATLFLVLWIIVGMFKIVFGWIFWLILVIIVIGTVVEAIRVNKENKDVE